MIRRFQQLRPAAAAAILLVACSPGPDAPDGRSFREVVDAAVRGAPSERLAALAILQSFGAQAEPATTSLLEILRRPADHQLWDDVLRTLDAIGTPAVRSALRATLAADAVPDTALRQIVPVAAPTRDDAAATIVELARLVDRDLERLGAALAANTSADVLRTAESEYRELILTAVGRAADDPPDLRTILALTTHLKGLGEAARPAIDAVQSLAERGLLPAASASTTLAAIGGPEAWTAMRRLAAAAPAATRGSWVVALSVAAPGDPAAATFLAEQALAEAAVDVRNSAIDGLLRACNAGTATAKIALPALVTAAADEDPRIATTARQILGIVAMKPSLRDTVSQALEDADAEVLLAVARALDAAPDLAVPLAIRAARSGEPARAADLLRAVDGEAALRARIELLPTLADAAARAGRIAADIAAVPAARRLDLLSAAARRGAAGAAVLRAALGTSQGAATERAERDRIDRLVAIAADRGADPVARGTVLTILATDAPERATVGIVLDGRETAARIVLPAAGSAALLDAVPADIAALCPNVSPALALRFADRTVWIAADGTVVAAAAEARHALRLPTGQPQPANGSRIGLDPALLDALGR